MSLENTEGKPGSPLLAPRDSETDDSPASPPDVTDCTWTQPQSKQQEWENMVSAAAPKAKMEEEMAKKIAVSAAAPSEGEWIPLSQRQAAAKAKIEEEEMAKKIAAKVAPCVLDETGVLVIPDKCLPIKHWTRWLEASKARSETLERRRTTARQLANKVMRGLAAKGLPRVYSEYLGELEPGHGLKFKPLDTPAAKPALPSDGEWVPLSQRHAQSKEKLEQADAVDLFFQVESKLKALDADETDAVVAPTAAPSAAPAPAASLPSEGEWIPLSQRQAPGSPAPIFCIPKDLKPATEAQRDSNLPSLNKEMSDGFGLSTPLPMLTKVNSFELFSKLHVTCYDGEAASDGDGDELARVIYGAYSNSFNFGGNKNLGAQRPKNETVRETMQKDASPVSK
jgi:hypothetical protein